MKQKMNNAQKIIPTVFSTSQKKFLERLNKLKKISSLIQIDYMDGLFVPTRSIHIADTPKLNTHKYFFEAHLMVSNPEFWIREAIKKGFQKIIFHIETCNATAARKLIRIIKSNNSQAFIAINPDTPLSKLFGILGKAKKSFAKDVPDGVLVMGATPGYEGQILKRNVPSRIRKIRNINKEIFLQIDGGINDKTTCALARAGADFLNSGGYVSNSKDPRKALAYLEYTFKKCCARK